MLVILIFENKMKKNKNFLNILLVKLFNFINEKI
jgi:hypothetical protein